MKTVEVTIIESLGIELLKVANNSPKGAHFEAARRVGIGPDAELKVRQRKLWIKDDPNTHQKMECLIQAYKDIIEEKKVA
ncbi:MAG: hypothetical protein AAF348_11580 [Bacteroidota bacterium]